MRKIKDKKMQEIPIVFVREYNGERQGFYFLPYQLVEITTPGREGLALVGIKIESQSLGELLDFLKDVQTWEDVKRKVRTLRLDCLQPPREFFVLRTTGALAKVLLEKEKITPSNARLKKPLISGADALNELKSLFFVARKTERKEEKSMPRTQNYPRIPWGMAFHSQNSEDEQASYTIPNLADLLIGAGVFLASLMFPPCASFVFGLAYNVGGWILSSSYFVAYLALLLFPVSKKFFFLVSALAITLFFVGLHKIYADTEATFDLWEAIRRWKSIRVKPPKQEEAKVHTQVFLTLQDFLIFAGVITLFFPRLDFILVPLLAFLLSVETRQRELWRLFVIPALVFRLAGLDFFYYALMIVSYASRSKLGLKLAQLPIKLRMRNLQRDSVLIEAFREATSIHGFETSNLKGLPKELVRMNLPPFVLKEVPEGFYTKLVPQVLGFRPTSPQQAVINTTMAIYARMHNLPFVGETPVIPQFCLPDGGKTCMPDYTVRPVVQDKLTLLMPLGVSVRIAGDIKNGHRHWWTLWTITPQQISHLLIVAPTGGGKTNLLKFIIQGAIDIANEFPVLVSVIEGKTELQGTNGNCFFFPATYLKDPHEIICAIAGIRAVMENREQLAVQLTGKDFSAHSGVASALLKALKKLPILICIVDEFWTLKEVVSNLGQIKASGVSVPGAKFMTAALTSLLRLARSLGIVLVYTTQTAKKEALPVGATDNALCIAGAPHKMHTALLDKLLGGNGAVLRAEIASTVSLETMEHALVLPPYTFIIAHNGLCQYLDSEGKPQKASCSWDIFKPPLHQWLRYRRRDTTWPHCDILETLASLLKTKDGKTEEIAWQAGLIPVGNIQDFLAFGERHLASFVASLAVNLLTEKPENEEL